MAEPDRSVVPALELRVFATASSLSYELRLREPRPEESRVQTFGPVDLKLPLADYLSELWSDLEEAYDDSPQERALAERRRIALGARLAEQLLPEPLRRCLAAWSTEPRSLVIVSDEPRIPWEIAWLEGGGPEPDSGCFLAEAFALARWLPGRREILELPFQDIGLLVASGSQLPNALSERAVVLGLANRDRRVHEISPEPLEVVDEIARGGHDAWHFIGHSSARAKNADRWPLELGGGARLRPDDLRSLDTGGGAPFVFLNSCTSGRRGFTLTGFGGWSERFLALGAGAFLGPQWSVRDRSSSRFAELFYERFRRGIPIAEAVRQARVALAPTDRGTRLSYALYAHPEAVCLHPDGPSADAGERPRWARSLLIPERGLLATWMDQVVKDHDRLVPYFQQQAEVGLLDRVYVKLDVRVEERLTAIAEAALGSDNDRRGRPLGLLDVLKLPRGGSVSGRWVVLGDSGTGKTTLLRHLAADLARRGDRPWVPLLESLPKVLRERKWLLDSVVRRLELAGHQAQGLAVVLDRAAIDGHLLLLLDGLDEVPCEEKEEAEMLLRDLSIRWPATPIVVASRPIGYRPPGGDYRELRLQPLDRDRRREFLARWLGRVTGVLDESGADTALAALEGSELSDLAGNPLYLTLMALLSEQGTEPARNRPKLYDQVFDLLLAGKHRLAGHPMAAQEAARELLRHLAFGMTEDNVDVERVEKLEDRLYQPEADAARDRVERVARWRGQMRQFLDDLSEQTGILGPHDGWDSYWRFWHRTFREALAAEHLEGEYRGKDGKASVLSRAQGITTEQGLSAWAEPFALLAGRLDAPDELVKDLSAKNLPLGLRSVATAQTLRPETLGEILALSEKWKERIEVYGRVPELVSEPRRALSLLDQLRQRTTNGKDLFFLDRAVREIGRRSPDHTREAEALAVRLYDHFPRPAEDLFRWIDTPKDGRVPLWREIPAGKTWIGSPEGEGYPDEMPRHQVTIAQAFSLAAVPVTNAQFYEFDPSWEPFEGEGVPSEELLLHPAVNVTWYEAISFCRWLAGWFPWAQGARLPLEEEWEHAGRAGSETRYWSGEEEKDLARVAWYDLERRSHRVGEKEANPWGLYDIHGNVWEWTLSPWTGNYEGREAGITIDSLDVDSNAMVRETPNGERRVLRGGSAWSVAVKARAAYRNQGSPVWVSQGRGFRVALPAVPANFSTPGDRS